MSDGHLEEFLTIVTRDLGAQSALVLDAADELREGANEVDPGLTLSCELPGGRRLVVRFAEPPADAEALERRLAMLASAFGDVLPHDARARASRPPPARSLHEELAALVMRAGALEALVIDANSPVIWGAAGDGADPPPSDTTPDLAHLPPPRPSGLQDVSEVIRMTAVGWEPDPEPEPPAPSSEPRPSSSHPPPALSLVVEHANALTERALAEVHALPDLALLHRGGHLRHSFVEPGFGYVARSFAAIYVLVVVFEGPFEELLVKRAVAQALPTIERLVAALPPLDPRPTAGVAAIRVRRRR